MNDDELLTTMAELAARITARNQAREVLENLEAEVSQLQQNLADTIQRYVPTKETVQQPTPPTTRPHFKQPAPKLTSKPVLKLLEEIKDSGPEGIPADKLHGLYPGWAFSTLVRTGYAKKTTDGNWVQASDR